MKMLKKTNISNTAFCGMLECSYFSKEAHISIITLYVTATLVNICGNSLVWKAVVNNKKLLNPINYLLLNLSLADMVSGISVYPYLFILNVGKVFDNSRKQARLCMVTEGLGLFFIASGVSLFTLCGISYNRFVAVRYPLKTNFQMGRKSAVVFSVLAWVICIAIMAPNMISFKYNSKFNSCIRNWGHVNGKAYRILLLLAGTIFPTLFLLMSYIAILFQARQRTIIDTEAKSKRSFVLKKAERMVGVLILVYLICWLPFSIFWTLRSVSNYFPRTVEGLIKSNRWLRTTVLFCVLNGTIDPFVYIFGSSKINEEVKDMFSKLVLSVRKKARCESKDVNHQAEAGQLSEIHSLALEPSK